MTGTGDSELYAAAEKFVRWVDGRLTAAGRGDRVHQLPVEPSGSFWLGRLAPEAAVVELGLGERGERIDPCATGIVLRPDAPAPWVLKVEVSCRVWLRRDGGWHKSDRVSRTLHVEISEDPGVTVCGASELADGLASAAGVEAFQAEVRVEVEAHPLLGSVLTVQLINTSPSSHPDVRDLNLYETRLSISSLRTKPFVLEALPDSFRYDRTVPAYGVNCGVSTQDDSLTTTDTVVVEMVRPRFWRDEAEAAAVTFDRLADDPLPALESVVSGAKAWAAENWSDDALDARARSDVWTTAMRAQADAGRSEFEGELQRLENGLRVLEAQPDLLRAFKLMNRAMKHAARGRYDGWRPFQAGFLLASCEAIVSDDSIETADIVWFATGGGKTETYLGLLVMAAFYDRLRGKASGITAWSRFPLRMLSLQQTQRFADAMGGAELVRREEHIPGDDFAVGFFVGQGATPNRLALEPKDSEPDVDDDDMPPRFQVLTRCPFCYSDRVEMAFDRRTWRLIHRCLAEECPWRSSPLPFYIVDEEIYRFLPTVVVGTLDKAASIGLQAAMRGFVASPLGVCSEAGHGFTYAPRGPRPNGCFVPGCRGSVSSRSGEAALFAPRFRLQDELHLLRDSLGAVDAHYESLLDHLQLITTGSIPKILASSATLSGFERQVDVLYRRHARVFPAPGPSVAESYWSTATSSIARRFVSVAPRGVTLEYAADRILTELQLAVRSLISDPEAVSTEAGFDPRHAAHLQSLYGVDVCYGNTLRDLEAVDRSLESGQVPLEPLNTASLTGRTPFTDVRATLARLEDPESTFDDRLHIITASSMMSHGVDIDRLNVMVMLGMPLATAEFIQTTARVGRTWPGLVVVLHKMARERDASVYRFFEQFVRNGDRLIEAIPIARRSRRVLESTIAGIQSARILHIHEPNAKGPLTKVSTLRDYFKGAGITADTEASAVVEALGLSGPLDEMLRTDVDYWEETYFRNLFDTGGQIAKPSDLSPTGAAMISLRDVEESAPIRESFR